MKTLVNIIATYTYWSSCEAGFTTDAEHPRNVNYILMQLMVDKDAEIYDMKWGEGLRRA